MLDPIDARLATGRAEGQRQWYVSKGGPTFCAVVGPGTLRDRGAGLPPQAHRFAVAATELTVAQFRAFRPDYQPDESVSPGPDCPANKVSWYAAAEYCNWLSQQDGIDPGEWCYWRTPDGKWEFVPGYQDRDGYRLPTEPEWEFACRAGARTRAHFGEPDAELAGRYAWWLGNAHAHGLSQAFPVGRLKPNDWGLFDMHGNVNELCQESVSPQEGRFQDVEVAYRGGSYVSGYHNQGCTRRDILGRRSAVPTIGVRVVRTLR
jgi:formylglycine-generating enzyme required for sulfatase activity